MCCFLCPFSTADCITVVGSCERNFTDSGLQYNGCTAQQVSNLLGMRCKACHDEWRLTCSVLPQMHPPAVLGLLLSVLVLCSSASALGIFGSTVSDPYKVDITAVVVSLQGIQWVCLLLRTSVLC